MHIRQAAHALGGDVIGRDSVLCPGPGHSPRDRSLSVRFVGGDFVVHSHANDDWQACRDHVRERLGLGTWQGKAPPIKRPPKPDDTIDRIGWARSIWRATKPAKKTLAERYLVETRRLELPDSESIRFHPRLKFTETGEFLPAMVCAMVDINTNEFTGVHRTYLTEEARKAGVLTLGRKLGSAIKIDPDEAVTDGLAIAEGVESTIAVRFLYRPAWSLIDANGVHGFPVLAGVEHLEIFADNDANKTGEVAAYACQERWEKEGAEVSIQTPPNVGGDIADIISNRKVLLNDCRSQRRDLQSRPRERPEACYAPKAQAAQRCLRSLVLLR
jgi:putative DNA primase/helicase